MSNEHVVSALRAKRAEIGGYIHDLEKKVATWRARLAHIDASIRIFSPETDPEAIPPRRTYRRSGYFKSGELARLCSGELRTANGVPLATAAIARNILNAKELPHDPDLVQPWRIDCRATCGIAPSWAMSSRLARAAMLNGRLRLP
jgi:hypothetical protein